MLSEKSIAKERKHMLSTLQRAKTIGEFLSRLNLRPADRKFLLEKAVGYEKTPFRVQDVGDGVISIEAQKITVLFKAVVEHGELQLEVNRKPLRLAGLRTNEEMWSQLSAMMPQSTGLWKTLLIPDAHAVVQGIASQMAPLLVVGGIALFIWHMESCKKYGALHAQCNYRDVTDEELIEGAKYEKDLTFKSTCGVEVDLLYSCRKARIQQRPSLRNAIPGDLREMFSLPPSTSPAQPSQR